MDGIYSIKLLMSFSNTGINIMCCFLSLEIYSSLLLLIIIQQSTQLASKVADQCILAGEPIIEINESSTCTAAVLPVFRSDACHALKLAN